MQNFCLSRIPKQFDKLIILELRINSVVNITRVLAYTCIEFFLDSKESKPQTNINAKAIFIVS